MYGKRHIALYTTAAILAGGAYVTWRTLDNSTDFDTYYFAARRVLDGLPLYMEMKDVSPYIYPPLFACCLAPMALFGLGPASFLWYLFNIALIVFSARAVSSLLYGGADIARRLAGYAFVPKALAVSISAAILLDNLSMLQVNILILAALLAGMFLIRAGRPFASAAAFAFAISVKVIPAIFFLYFLAKRRFGMAALIAVFAAAFTVAVPAASLGPREAGESLARWTTENFGKTTGRPNFQMMDNMFNPENQSLTAIISRWAVRNDADVLYWKGVSHEYPAFLHNITLGLDAAVAVTAGKILTAIIVMATLIVCALPARPSGAGPSNTEYALVFLAALLSSPILRSQHFSLVIFPVFAALLGTRPVRTLALFLALYASMALRIFEIAGLAGIAVLYLWAVFLVGCLKEKRGAVLT